MATLISATPPLNIKETKEFLKKVELNFKAKSTVIPTPKIENVVNKIIKDLKEKYNCPK